MGLYGTFELEIQQAAEHKKVGRETPILLFNFMTEVLHFSR